MNIIPFLILCLAIFVFVVETVSTTAWRVQRIALGLSLFATGVLLAFVIQPHWGLMVVH